MNKRWLTLVVGGTAFSAGLLLGFFPEKQHARLAAGSIALALQGGLMASLWQKMRGGRRGTFSALASLLALYSRSDAASESLLSEKIRALKIEGILSESELKWMERLKQMAELRGLVFGKAARGRAFLRQAVCYQAETGSDNPDFNTPETVSLQDITESATLVAELYWKLFETATSAEPQLALLARKLLADIFQFPYEAHATRDQIERLTDQIQRNGGAPFMILNLLRRGQIVAARDLAQRLLTHENVVDEDLRSALYWIAELLWFTRAESSPIQDHDSSLRYLYHLCFTNPERAGFLEVDSRFFSQFEIVNEIAREGFLFKESLIERILGVWKEYPGYFDGVFKNVLESMTATRSKIQDSVDAWEGVWKREQETFSRDYLSVVEGNLSYASGHFSEAISFYEKAVSLNPGLRSARLNLLFAYARAKRWDKHEALSRKLQEDKALHPHCLFTIANSLILTGQDVKAETYYAELKRVPGWERKADHYRSTFCFENGLHDKALKAALMAHALNPEDSAISYHLSLCYNVLGQKEKALEVLNLMHSHSELQWLQYYRFTLERDAGHHNQAAKTLLNIPREYFEDPEELEAALHFAREHQDLTLLRHLKPPRRRD